MKYIYEITLLSDAEPSSGLGTELLNGMLPRNANGNVCIPASHLKGLMRENFHNYLLPFIKEGGLDMEYSIFGRGGDEEDNGKAAILHCSMAEAQSDCNTLVVNRTAIDEKGIAKDKSLRANEALACGSKLKGSFYLDSEDEFLNTAARFALLSILALGGGRTRGAGRCKITIQGHEDETPGALLIKLANANKEYKDQDVAQPATTGTCVLSKNFVALKLDFSTDAPLLLPEHPLGKSNVLTSGFTIPATAVAGALLTLISKKNNDLASALFKAENFRCNPLLPVSSEVLNDLVLPVYVSNTHKISKLPQDANGNHLFADTMIPDDCLEPEFHWQDATKGKSMKGVDGVLYVRKDRKKIGLLRAKEIPLLYSAHAVVNGDGNEDAEKLDNLFTTEAICVKHFSGMIIIPEDAAQCLLALLGDNGKPVSFGKARSLYGTGTLTASRWDGFSDFPQVEKLRNKLFIVQSPIVFDLESIGMNLHSSSREVLAKLLEKAGWGELDQGSTTTSVLFGWNQTVAENRIGTSCRTKAQRVILPGSVFSLKGPLKDEELTQKLALGLGENHYAGFGAVLPHPMFATELCQLEKANASDKAFSNPQALSLVSLGYQLNTDSGSDLSPSQIARLMRKVALGMNDANVFLREQCEARPTKIQDSWKLVRKTLEEKVFSLSQDEALIVLRVWHDLKNGGAE